MVVVIAGDHVATQTRRCERCADGGGEADGVERRVHTQRDPRGDIVVRNPKTVGLLAPKHHGQPLVLTHHRFGRDGFEQSFVVDEREHERARSLHRLQEANNRLRSRSPCIKQTVAGRWRYFARLVTTDVLFLPGAGGAAEFWQPVASRLPARWRKTLLSWPGAGNEPRDPRITSYGDLVSMTAKAVGEKTDLVAQSMGGVMATGVALEQPARVRRLYWWQPRAGST